MLISAIYQHDLSIGIHMSPTFWTFLLSPMPAHPLGCHIAPGLKSLCLMGNSYWLSTLHMVMYMFQWYCLNSSHALHHPLGPQVCSLCLHLHCCPANRFFSSIFLDPIHTHTHTYIYIYALITVLFFSFWLISLCIIGSSFIHLIRMDSNVFILMAGVIFLCTYVPLLYPFICRWTSRLLPRPSYYK